MSESAAKKVNSKTLVLCAMFAALSCVLSPFTIPIGPIPIGFAHIVIFTCAGMLGAKYATVSQTVFVLLGMAGLPVFSGLRGGLGVITGPTGGFIIGYILCAFVVGLLIQWLGKTIPKLILAMYVGWGVTYICGVAWFMIVMRDNEAYGLSIPGLIAVLNACVIPFLIGDVFKTLLSALLVNRLQFITEDPS
ncbi:MAG: biotin transporter BioY [Oscillospiraceae bacterium]|nr:biotin transporter BioY [Oscillospiraceae bacterium]